MSLDFQWMFDFYCRHFSYVITDESLLFCADRWGGFEVYRENGFCSENYNPKLPDGCELLKT